AKSRVVNAYCTLRPVSFTSEKYKSYSFTDDTKEFSSRTIPLGTITSNDRGEADFKLNIPKGILPPSQLSASIGATVLELGGRGVTSSTERSINPYPYYIGIRKAAEGYANINEEVSFDYLVVSPDGEKIVAPLTVSVHKVIWDSVVKKDENGKYRYVSEKRDELILEDSISAQTKGGKFTFIPQDWGDYIVRIKGEGEDTHTASAQFYCSGYGYIPWAMERPDRIELKLDKKIYARGDQAKLVINSPFKGKALITVSKDEVLFTRSVDLTSTTQTVTLPIDDSFEPNAYCSVTVIRPVALEEQWSAHRAYGIIPVSLDNSDHKLEIDIKTNASASPKDTVKVKVKVRPRSQLNKASQLSIALVDEGILSLTAFSTPDPFNFFYGKRANSIVTSDIYSLLIPEFEEKKLGADSSPSGDGAPEGFNPQKYLNPIRAERVKPVVLWKTNITTDDAGEAEAEFTIPEFTGSLRVMAVASSGRDFGNADSNIKVTEPLMVKPTLPRFLAANDELIVPVTVFNTTGQSGQATVIIKPSQEFQILSEESIIEDIENNTEASLQFRLKSPNLATKALIKVSASLGNHFTSRTIELPVRPPAPFTTVSGSGSVDAPGESKVSIPGGWLKGTEKASFAVMSLPTLQFAGSLNYLMKYPYGCIEQTTSGAYPLLYLKKLTTIVDPKSSSASAVDTYIDAGIQRVLSMQTYTGGFAMWPGYQEPYDWGSVYATDFLVEAEKAGYAVPKLDKEIALDYLEDILSGRQGDESLDLKSYACYVLAKAGRMKASWVRRLQEKKEDLSGSSKLYLIASLAILGDKEAVTNMLGQGFPDPKIKRETGGSLASNTKENAVALSVFMDVDPKNSIVPVLVKRLTASMEKGRWQSTQDNAQALLGLGKYAKFVESQSASYFGRVSVGEEVLTEFDSDTGAKIKDLSLGGKEVTLSLSGEGTAYYYWSVEGVPEGGVAEEDKGMRIRRKFYTREGKPLD
ncbi:MAG: alpha-2-macroglobulin family protein, partial [Candidatus Omnitrophota bacterium]